MFLLMFSSGLFCFNLNKLSNIHTISILILFVSECRKKFHWMRKRSGWCWNTEERNRRGQTQRRSWRGFQEVSKILLKYTDRNQRAISHELAVDDERVWCSVWWRLQSGPFAAPNTVTVRKYQIEIKKSVS